MPGLRNWNGVNQGSLAPLLDAATIVVDATVAQCFVVTLGGNRILGLPTGGVVGSEYEFIIKQDGTGSRLLTYATGWLFPGGAPTATTTASAIDVIRAWTDGTSWYGVMSKAYA